MTTATAIIKSAFREGNLIAVNKTPTAPEQAEGLDRLNALISGIFGYELGENLTDWLVPQPQRTAPVSANYPQAPTTPRNSSGNVYPYPPSNRRIVYGGKAQTVYFPQSPSPGSQMAVVQGSGAGDSGATGDVLTLNGNGRLIQDPMDGAFKSQVQFTFNSGAGGSQFAPARWFYRDDLGQWLLLQNLTTSEDGGEYTDLLPFPLEFDDFFICALAKRIAGRYGKVTASETMETAKVALGRLKARYRQAGVTTYNGENTPSTNQSYSSGSWWW